MWVEWDDGKAKANEKKHGVRFEEAASVFADPNYRFFLDTCEYDEPRFKTIGFDKYGRVLVVIFTIRNDNAMHIISARRATKNERKQYGKDR